MAVPELSIIVVSYNTRELLAQCLGSLGAAASRTPHEIIVVDNASRDGSVEMLGRQFPGATSIANRVNVGFARAVNRGIRASRGEFLALVNSDAEALPGSLDALAAFLRARPTVGAVGPQTLGSDGRPIQSAFRFPTLLRPYLNFATLRWVAGDAFSLSYPRGSRAMAEGGPVDWLSGACLVLRRKALEQVGLLDERFFMYFEDTDLCRRLRRGGWAVWYWPQVRVVHHVGGSSGSDRERLRLELRRSCLHYFRVHHPGPVFWAVRGLVAGGALTRLALGHYPFRRAGAAPATDPATERRILRLALRGADVEGPP
jgi:GT2 family glycosyltransferase